MTTDTHFVTPEAAIGVVASEMALRGYGCAVVIERGKVAGIFTATDAVATAWQAHAGAARGDRRPRRRRTLVSRAPRARTLREVTYRSADSVLRDRLEELEHTLVEVCEVERTLARRSGTS